MKKGASVGRHALSLFLLNPSGKWDQKEEEEEEEEEDAKVSLNK